MLNFVCFHASSPSYSWWHYVHVTFCKGSLSSLREYTQELVMGQLCVDEVQRALWVPGDQLGMSTGKASSTNGKAS